MSVGLVLGDSYDLTVIVDGSVAEVFLLGGQRSATQTYYVSEEGGVLDQVKVEALDLMASSRVSVEVRELRSGWKGEENANGVVTGNTTAARAKRDGIVDGLREWWA